MIELKANPKSTPNHTVMLADGAIGIILTGRTGIAIAVIDARDYPLVKDHRWYPLVKRRTTYVQANLLREDGTRTCVLLHRMIMAQQLGPAMDVDHRNHNGLDNRRRNLRPATRAQNLMNRLARRGTSQYLGVHWSARKQRWRAQIRIDGEKVYLGSFASEKAAARAYDAAASEHHGEFAQLNLEAK